MENNEEKYRRQCIGLGVAALLLLGALTFQTMKKRGEELTAVNQEMIQSTEETTGESLAGLEISGSGSQGSISDEKNNDLLILVNKDNRIPDDYNVELHWLSNGSCAVADVMYDALKEMLTDGSVNGRQFVVASGYRDTQKQEELLEEDIIRSMEEYGMTWEQAYILETRETMPPGYSEHETGLAVDIVSLDYQVLDEVQESTAENIWLRENCSRYGFILRYPQGKEDITGIDYESWHFRYVGVDAAEEITRRGITLEEYREELGAGGIPDI